LLVQGIGFVKPDPLPLCVVSGHETMLHCWLFLLPSTHFHGNFMANNSIPVLSYSTSIQFLIYVI